MKKVHLLFLILLIPLLLNSYIFEVDKFESLVFITSALAVDLSNNYFDRQLIEAPTDFKLEALNEDDVPFFDRIGLQPYSSTLKDFSDYSAYLTIGSTLFCLYENDKELILNNILVLGEIMIAQSAIAKWTKTLTHRYRPFVYGDVSYDKKKQRNSQHSFYSMHSSTVFAAATCGYYYYFQKYGNNILIGSLLFGSASATAILRVAAAQHFPSDVIVGAIVGSGMSYVICKHHQNKKIKLFFGYDSIDISYKF